MAEFDFKSFVEEFVKIAQGQEPGVDDRSLLDKMTGRNKYHYLFGKRISREKAKNVEETLKKSQPRTEEEKHIQQIVGARPTEGQIKRMALLGAGGGLAMHVGGAAIEGGKKWLPDLSDGVVKGLLRPKTPAVLSPRSLARSAAVGGILSGAVPVAKQFWDIQTALENPKNF